MVTKKVKEKALKAAADEEKKKIITFKELEQEAKTIKKEKDLIEKFLDDDY